MKQDIQISVLGIQNAGSVPEAVSTVATGRYYFENGFHRISYCELDEYRNAMEKSLFLSQEGVRLNKNGFIIGQFLFIPHEKTVASYLSSFGEIVFHVETKYYNLKVKKECINAQLKYCLYSEGQFFSENTLDIQIRENG